MTEDDTHDRPRGDADDAPRGDAHDRPRGDAHDDVRSQIVRRATLYSIGFLAAGLIIALGGAALVAWLFSRGGLPFLKTWLVVTAIIVLPGLLAALWKLIRGR